MKKKRSNIKKIIRKQFNGFNVVIIILSVFISFCSVSFCNSFQQQNAATANNSDLSFYASRLADSFELYNKRRFQ